jgi:hypothetical protein
MGTGSAAIGERPGCISAVPAANVNAIHHIREEFLATMLDRWQGGLACRTGCAAPGCIDRSNSPEEPDRARFNNRAGGFGITPVKICAASQNHAMLRLEG